LYPRHIRDRLSIFSLFFHLPAKITSSW
jgi:hypothetical protein